MENGKRRLTQRIYLAVKRGLDILISAILLVPSAFVMGVFAILIKAEDGGPVLFKQDRIGRGGKTFKFYKLRSMRVNSEHTGTGVYSEKDDPRVLKVGKIARMTSIDELPQLINILRGDMSLIGPRPPLTYHPWPIEEYTDEQRKMFDVRPGITGWAQVNGYRGDTSIRKRIDCDLYYIENWTMGLDIKILFLTIFKGFVNKNAY